MPPRRRRRRKGAMGCDLHHRLFLLLVAVARPLHGARAVHRLGWLHPPPEFLTPCTVTERGFTDHQRGLIVKAHNDYRSRVAKGGLPGFEPAADMCEVIWDEDLESVAQSYVEQCAPHAGAVATRRNFIEEGQSLCIQPLAASSQKTGVLACIDSWFGGHAVSSPAVIKSFINVSEFANGTYEGFTQLVWSLSQYVGCGFALVSAQDGETRNLYACNYDQPGNHAGTPVYLAGSPCSACPLHTTCVNETGLCRSDAVATDKSVVSLPTTREQPVITSGAGAAWSRRTSLWLYYSSTVGMATVMVFVLTK